MDETLLWLVEIIGPAILLVVLIWLVLKVRGRRDGSIEEQNTEAATHELYDEEERRRRDGTDGL